MHWLQNAFSSFSSSSSKSSIDCHRKENGRSLNLFRKRRVSRSHPRLTRQRKFRHLSDDDVGRLPLGKPSSPPSRPRSLPVSQSPRSIDYQSNWTSSAVPQPLPLPELPSNFRPESLLSPLSSRNRPISLAKVVPSRGEGEGTDYLIGEWTGEEIKVPPSHITERFAPQTNHSSRGPGSRTYKSPADHVRMMPRDSNAAVNTQNTDSAFTSGFSSPALSPRRFSAGDVFSSLYTLSQRIQAWPASDLTSLDMLAGFSHQTSLDRTIYSPDLSPQYSPRTSGLNSRNPSGSTSPLHYKFNPESTLVPVYQLPRPPGTPVSSQSSFSHQNTTKSEVVSMLSQWQKGKLIGRGTFGSVYVATNTETGAYCAMKEVDLIPDDTKSAECIKQLKQEINVLSQLKHQNIVQFYGSEIVGNHFYIYLEYVHPGSLNKYVHEHCEAVTENVVRNFTRHILHGLDYLHSTKTVHRDIKGANLLVDASGVVKLADFGLAKHFTGKVADLSLKGSPHWMAPELIHAVMLKDNNSDLAFAVDIWSLGCTIIEMLTGKPPWSEVEGAAAMFKVLRESPPIPETLSSEGKDFLKCCFRRNPAERPSASKLLEHRFVRNSHQGGATTALTQAFSGMKLMDIAHSPREQNRYKSDSILSSTSNTKTIKGKQPIKSETGQQSHTETCNSAEASRHSLGSTLETLPSLLSPPNLSQSTSCGHSPNVVRSPQPSSKNGHFNAHLRTRGSGKEFPFLF